MTTKVENGTITFSWAGYISATIEVVPGENGTIIKYNGPMGMGDRTVQLDLTK